MLTAVSLALLVLPSTILVTAVPEALTGRVKPDATTLLLALISLLIGLAARITLARIAMGPATTVGGGQNFSSVYALGPSPIGVRTVCSPGSAVAGAVAGVSYG